MTLTLVSSSCSIFRSAGIQSRRYVLPEQRISIEEVYSSRDHLGIYGRLYRPVGVKGRLPLVILSHGFGVTHRDGEGYAELLTRMGYLCYTFDFNGGGRESLSAGATTDMSVLTEQADLNAVIDQLKRRSDVDPRYITLLGLSQGGLVSALTAASRPDDIASLILIYPAFSIPEMVRKQWGEYRKIPLANTLWGMRLGEKYYKDVWNIDPYAVIGPRVRIGAGCKVGAHVVLEGPTTLGENNRLYPFCSVGAAPQDKKYAGEDTALEIGNGNTIRECVTINRGTVQDGGTTRVGDDNWIMAYVHIAHDCVVGNHTIFANTTNLAGHVHIGDWVILGGNSQVHQFCKIGAHAMTGAGSIVLQGIPPYVMASGNPLATHGINSEGLRRRGLPQRQARRVGR